MRIGICDDNINDCLVIKELCEKYQQNEVSFTARRKPAYNIYYWELYVGFYGL